MKRVIIILFALLLSGCILPYPHTNWTSPAVYGYIIDQDTGQPIAGAQVSIKGDPLRAVITGSRGYYELLPTKEFDWFVLICPGPCDAVSGNFIVVATHKEYSSEEEEVMGCIGHPDSVCNGRERSVIFRLQKGI